MANDSDAFRSALNDLIETCKDSEEGFREAGEKLKDPSLHTLFLELSLQRAQYAGELQAEVTNMGSEPTKSGSTMGAIHRGWIGLKTALGGDSDHAILEEAERGEEAAVKNYREALSKDLPTYLSVMVARQLKEIQRTHHTLQELRDKHHPDFVAPMVGLK